MSTLQRLAYTVAESTNIVPLSRSKLYAMIAAGEIRTVTVAGKTLIPSTELEALVAGS